MQSFGGDVKQATADQRNPTANSHVPTHTTPGASTTLPVSPRGHAECELKSGKKRHRQLTRCAAAHAVALTPAVLVTRRGGVVKVKVKVEVDVEIERHKGRLGHGTVWQGTVR